MTFCPDGCEGCRRAVCTLGWGDAEPERATGFLRRLAGLSAGKRDRQRIMAFPSCSSVHTLTMRRPIDIAFISHDGIYIQNFLMGNMRCILVLRMGLLMLDLVVV